MIIFNLQRFDDNEPVVDRSQYIIGIKYGTKTAVSGITYYTKEVYYDMGKGSTNRTSVTIERETYYSTVENDTLVEHGVLYETDSATFSVEDCIDEHIIDVNNIDEHDENTIENLITDDIDVVKDAMDTFVEEEDNAVEALDEHIESLIGPDIQAPAPMSGQHISNSGTIVYWKVESQIIDTQQYSCTIEYTTHYGLDSNCSIFFSTKTLTVTSTEYAEKETFINNTIMAEVNDIKNTANYGLIDILLSTTIDTTYTPVSNITYKYRVEYSQHPGADFNENSMTGTITWGLENSITNTWATKDFSFDTTNFDQATTQFNSFNTTKVQEMKDYLATLIGLVNLPNDYTYTYISNSGKQFYFKTAIEHLSSDDTHYRFRYTTTYGYAANDEILHTRKIHDITASNYDNYATSVENLARAEWNTIITTLLNTWDFVIPSDYTETWRSEGGLEVGINVKYTQGSTNNTDNNIILTTTYTIDGGNEQQFETNGLLIRSTNVSSAGVELVTLRNASVDRLKDFINVPNVVLPSNISTPYTVNGFTYRIAFNYEKGDSQNIVLIKAFVDGVQYGSTITKTYNRTLEEASNDIASETTNIDTAIKAILVNSNENTSETITKGNVIYSCETQYAKAAGSTSVNVKVLVDGMEFRSNYTTININTFIDNQTDAKYIADTGLSALKDILDTTPVNDTTVVNTRNVRSTVSLEYTKAAGSFTAIATIKYHNQTYATVQQILNASTLANDISTWITNAEAKYQELKDFLDDKNPVDTSITKTIGTMNYTIETKYTKDSAETITYGRVYLDGVQYGVTCNRSMIISTFDNSVRVLKADVKNVTDALESVLTSLPSNKSYTKTVGGFNYAIDLIYSKTAGSTSGEASIKLDGVEFDATTHSITSSTLDSDITSLGNDGVYLENTLIGILDTSPADSDSTSFTVNGFTYTIGATFTKAANDSNVGISIKVDGAKVVSNTMVVDTSLTDQDISDISNWASTNIETVKGTLGGIEPDVDSHTINNFSFNIVTLYTKADGKIITKVFLDSVEYSSDQEDFDYTKLTQYHEAGLAKISTLKNILNVLPANISEVYTVNGFKFDLGVEYFKDAGSTMYYIRSIMDNKRVGNDNGIIFNASNIASVSSNGTLAMNTLKEILDNSPANISIIHTKGGFNWAITATYSKTQGNDSVAIDIALESTPYLDTIYRNFNIDNISDLSNFVNGTIKSIKDQLDMFPINTREIYKVNHCSFLIEKCYVKAANNNTMTTFVKLDGSQYGDSYTDTFDMSKSSSISLYNDSIVVSLKNDIDPMILSDQTDSFYKKPFTYTITIQMWKDAGDPEFKIHFDIDNDLFEAYSVPLIGTIQTITQDQFNALIEENIASVKDAIEELSYVGSEVVFARLLSVQSDINENE